MEVKYKSADSKDNIIFYYNLSFNIDKDPSGQYHSRWIDESNGNNGYLYNSLSYSFMLRDYFSQNIVTVKP